MELTTHAISLPVYMLADRARRIHGDILGTCFPIGDDCFLTAGHVVAALGDPSSRDDLLPVVGVYSKDSGLFLPASIVEAEQLEHDLGVLRVSSATTPIAPTVHRLGWHPVPWGFDKPVRSIGYAYGLNRLDDSISIIQRAFRGHIVASVDRFRPVGATGGYSGIYELSFMAPRGLSGAPLLNDYGTLMGVVIGNTKTRMLVFDSEEKIIESGQTTVVEQYESLTLGVAIRGDVVLATRSSLLGRSIADHVSVTTGSA